jgi:hypothetical protein
MAVSQQERLAARSTGGRPWVWVGYFGRKGEIEKREREDLMHTKYMHDLCSLLMNTPTYYDAIIYYNHVL